MVTRIKNPPERSEGFLLTVFFRYLFARFANASAQLVRSVEIARAGRQFLVHSEADR